jgi:ribosomal protein S18 acetylase RimI-like enzyme
MSVEITPAADADVPELADVAARTFPLACPSSSTPDDIAAFIAENLTAERFREYLGDADRMVLTARSEGRMSGYAMLIRGIADDADVQRAVTLRPAVELSKMYVLPDDHGAGVSAALMTAALDAAQALDAACVWLGVNQKNQRAQRFYAKQGFTRAGTKTFRLGSDIENDYVLVRPLTGRAHPRPSAPAGATSP